MTFTAEPGPASATGWRGHGSARVRAVSVGDDWRLLERGHFTLAGSARSVAFRNLYRWQCHDATIALSHERFGVQAAVFLFDLVPTDPYRLVSSNAHRCGHDSYHASLTLVAGGFDLAWRILGPAKDEHLHYSYRAPASDHLAPGPGA